jgi:hypothetical protein
MGAQRILPSTLKNVVIVEVRKRDHGPPLLPVSKDAAGEANLEGWTSPGTYIHLADYLCALLNVVTGLDWSAYVRRSFEEELLPAYQAAVDAETWERVWEALMKPVKNMRACYRQLHGCRNAPDLFFGVAPKPVYEQPAAAMTPAPVPSGDGERPLTGALPAALQPVLQESMQAIRDVKRTFQKPLRNRLLRKKTDVPPVVLKTDDVPAVKIASPQSAFTGGMQELWDAPIPSENTFVHFREDFEGVFRKAKSAEVS